MKENGKERLSVRDELYKIPGNEQCADCGGVGACKKKTIIKLFENERKAFRVQIHDLQIYLFSRLVKRNCSVYYNNNDVEMRKKSLRIPLELFVVTKCLMFDDVVVHHSL